MGCICSFKPVGLKKKSIFDALKCGNRSLLEALCHPLKNDVTDFVRSALSTISERSERNRILNHLMDAYRQILLPNENILDSDSRMFIANLTAEKLFS